LAIALAHQTTVSAIASRNGLADRHTIRAGQKLIIPVEYGPSATPSASTMQHVVKAGESLSTIAAQYGVSVQSLININALTNPSLIRVGQVLVIPEK